MIISNFDGLDGKVLRGWVLDRDQLKRTLRVSIMVDGRLAAECVADHYRPDLAEALGEGRHEFQWTLPYEWMTGKSHLVSVVCPETGSELRGSPLHCDFPKVPRTGGDFVKTNVQKLFGPGLKNARGNVALLAVNEQTGRLNRVQIELIREVKSLDFEVVIINSSTTASEAFVGDASKYVDLGVIRKDHGRDFGSWIVAMVALRDRLKNYKNVLLLNDSMFGPLKPLGAVYDACKASRADIVGLTDSWETNYHLQSYFMLFKNGAAFEKTFQAFVDQYEFPDKKEEVISQGEIALGRTLSNSNLEVEALYPYERVADAWLSSYEKRIAHFRRLPETNSGSKIIRDGVILPNAGHVDFAVDFLTNVASDVRHMRPLNPTHFFWDTLIAEFGFPFVKRELLTLNPSRLPNILDFFTIAGPLSHAQRLAIKQALRRVGKIAPPPIDEAQFDEARIDEARIDESRASAPQRNHADSGLTIHFAENRPPATSKFHAEK